MYNTANIASSNLQSDDLDSKILFENNISSTALLSAETEANIGLVLTRHTTTKQSSLIHKYTHTVTAEEKACTKKSYFCRYYPFKDLKGYYSLTHRLQIYLKKHKIK